MDHLTATPAEPDRPSPLREARFVSGSIFRHILVMTVTGALGLIAVFAGDMANLLFLGRLHDTEVLSAVGYASALLFLSISVSIGLSIGATAAIAPSIGAGDKQDAQGFASNALMISVLVSAALTLFAYPYLDDLAGLIGATGRSRELAEHYLQIVYPTFPLMSVAMTCSGVLRSVGDARSSMLVTVLGAIVNTILDAVLIVGLNYGLEGAAWASVVARFTMAGVGLWAVISHGMLQVPNGRRLRSDFRRLMVVGLPALATNLATPVASAVVTRALADYGDAAIAAWSVVGRVHAVAFGAVFAITGAIGPIVGQNLGAGDFARVRRTIIDAGGAVLLFTAVAWAVLAVSPGLIVSAFGLGNASVHLIYLSCWVLPPLFTFLGFLFVANAVFNTLRHPHYATAFNWGRATLGTIPFVIVGGHWAGAPGIFVASLASAVPFGAAALWISLRLVDRLAHGPIIPAAGFANKARLAWSGRGSP